MTILIISAHIPTFLENNRKNSYICSLFKYRPKGIPRVYTDLYIEKHEYETKVLCWNYLEIFFIRVIRNHPHLLQFYTCFNNKTFLL